MKEIIDVNYISAVSKNVHNFIAAHVPLTPIDWEIFFNQLEFFELEKNEIISNQGDVENYMYCIFEGVVRKFNHTKEKEYTLGFQFPVSFFTSYSSFIMRIPSMMSLQALSYVRLARISYQNMQTLYKDAPNAEQIGRKMIELNYVDREIKEVKLNTLDAKENYLDLLATNKLLVQQIPQKYIASYLGITPQSLSRIRKHI